MLRQSPRWGSISWLWDHDLRWNQELLNQLSQPGTHPCKWFLNLLTDCFDVSSRHHIISPTNISMYLSKGKYFVNSISSYLIHIASDVNSVFKFPWLCPKKIFLMFIYFWESTAGEGKTERDRGWSGLCTDSSEPDVELELTNCEITTWTEVRRRSQTLNGLSHPGTPYKKFFVKI